MDEKKKTLADIIAEVRREYYAGAEYDGSEVQNIIDRIEAAHKREIESITPKPDPDWKNICAKCMEGEIEPKHCEYYGEPNGCSSPIYGKHPTAEQTSVVGNGAKMCEALEATNKFLEVAIVNGKVTSQDISRLRNIVSIALSESPRNCDRLPNRAAAIEAYQKNTGLNKHPAVLWTAAQIYAFIDWLFATKKGENDAIK